MYLRNHRLFAAIFCGFFSALAAARVSGETVTANTADHVVLRRQGQNFLLQNRAVCAHWSVAGGNLSGLVIRDRIHEKDIPVDEPFRILLKDGTILDAAHLKIAGEPTMTHVTPTPDSAQLAATFPGEAINVEMETSDRTVHVQWSMVLLEGSHYIRQIVTIAAAGEKDVPISRVQLIDLALPGAHVVGSVNGSPIVAGNLFVGFEHPLSQSKVRGDRATAWIERELPLRAGQTVTYSSVIGVAREGQMRRDFLAYLERERAHPYRTFLHYNSWYDLGYFTPYTATDAVDRINAFGRELTEKRGVKLDSFLFDDGWDKHDSLWKFNSGFPDGFTPLKNAAEKYDADPGVWMSPWGGYSKPKQERIAFGHEAGYEIVGGGYALVRTEVLRGVSRCGSRDDAEVRRKPVQV